MKNTHHHKIAIGFLGTAFFAVLSVSVFLYLFIVIQKKNINIAETTVLVDNLNQSLKEHSTIKKTLETTKGERDILSSYFINSDTVVSFLERIEGYKAITNTEIVITDVDIDEDLKILNLSLSASGDFQDLYQLLLLLENAPVEFEFQATSFSKVGPSGASAPESVLDNGASVWSAEFDMHLISFEL